MKLARINLTNLSYPKTQMLRYSNNAPAAIKLPSFLTKSQDRLTLAEECRTIQRNSYETKADPSAKEQDDLGGENVPMSQEEYLKHYTFPKDRRSVFAVGKIISVLHIRKAYDPKITASNEIKHQSVLYGEVAYSSIYDFVVVDEIPGREFCYGCPLHTYNDQGVGNKRPAVQHDHVMLHSAEYPPSKQEGEIHMQKDPLAVKMYHRMALNCRADLLTIYSIYYHQRVREVGVVKFRSLRKLLRYREEIHESGRVGRRWRITKTDFV